MLTFPGKAYERGWRVVRTWSVVSVALLAGILLLALALTTGVEGVFPRPAEAAGVKVSVACEATPERTRVENNTGRTIKVNKVGSIHQPRSNEPFRVSARVRPGRAVTFESGSGANDRKLTGQYIYDNDVGSREGARVATSVGRFKDRC